MANDFFDDDGLSKATPGGSRVDSDEAGIASVHVSRMVRQKDEIHSQVASAVKELEELRLRQKDLELAKDGLEELCERQRDYESGKAELVSALGRGIVLLLRQEKEARDMAELMQATREKFGDVLDDLKAIDEGAWPDEGFGEELAQAIAVLDSARSVYEKAQARLASRSWASPTGEPTRSSPLDRVATGLLPERRFGFWFKAGLGFSLPVIFLTVMALVVMLVLRFLNWI